MNSLFLIVLWPALSALAILLCKGAKQVRTASLVASAIQLGLTLYIAFEYYTLRRAGDHSPFMMQSNLNWFPQFGISLHMGIDGISLAMLLLTSVVVLCGVLVSWNISYLTKEFYFLLILLSMGAYGFFISLDLFTLFFFLELAVIPKFMLIGIWGSGRKEYAAMKLALMLMGGSALILIGLLGVYFNSHTSGGLPTFDLLKLSVVHIPRNAQHILFPFLFLGFGVFTAIFPFHTWAPDGHSSAPTAASMFLAGISMKLGGYGCIRVACLLMPEAAQYYGPAIIVLACIAILYGAFATMMQKDLKYINAYSSVSHCGFVLLGIAMFTQTALIGAVMQMVSHGLMTALFFAVIGMLYERTHTRMTADMSGLLKIMPFLGTVFIIAGLCSLGLPGLSGFVSEMTIFMGSWQRPDAFHRIATILACASIVVTAVYILRAAGKVLMGPISNEHFRSLKDAAWNEKLASVILILSIVLIGVAPFLLSGLIRPGAFEIMKTIANATVLN